MVVYSRQRTKQNFVLNIAFYIVNPKSEYAQRKLILYALDLHIGRAGTYQEYYAHFFAELRIAYALMDRSSNISATIFMGNFIINS